MTETKTNIPDVFIDISSAGRNFRENARAAQPTAVRTA